MIGTAEELGTAMEVLERLSQERPSDGFLRDAISVVRDELFELLWSSEQ